MRLSKELLLAPASAHGGAARGCQSVLYQLAGGNARVTVIGFCLFSSRGNASSDDRLRG
jgi:hypothetical protein